MTFNDLPDDWHERPLTDQRLVANVLDLLVGDRDRREGCLLLAFCDDHDRLVQPCIIDELPDDLPADEIGQLVSTLADVPGGIESGASVLVAFARPRGLSATSQDLEWRTAVERACDGHIRLLGVHLVTAEGSRPVPRSAAA